VGKREGDAVTATEISIPDAVTAPTWTARMRITPRTIQMVLGIFWILDGALQLQPFMFGRSFVTQVILVNASGQPSPIAWTITSLGHFILPDIGVWNLLFALTQLTIGVGLLFRKTVKQTLKLMFVWCFLVWWFGEGFGGLLTGTATPLRGAPGAVILYAAIGVLVWPSPEQTPDSIGASEPTGIASSAAGRGPLGSAGALAVWATFWLFSAFLFLLPDNRARSSIHDAVASTASGQPAWYAHLISSVAAHLATASGSAALVFTIFSLVVGLGPLFTNRPAVFLVFGIAAELIYWVVSQGLGGIFTGSGTDPGTGPLVALLGVALLPTAVRLRGSTRPPITSMMQWNPRVTGGLAAGAGVALLLSATYPIATIGDGTTESSPTSSQLQAKLLTISDMPPNWTVVSSLDSATVPATSCLAGLDLKDPQGTKAIADFTQIGGLTELEEVLATGTVELSHWQNLSSAVAHCHSATLDFGGDPASGTAEAIPFPTIGARSIAYEVGLQGSDSSATIDDVFFRTRSYVGRIEFVDHGASNDAKRQVLLEALVTEAVSKLGVKPWPGAMGG
jgi:hypothetical protein